MKPLDFFKKNLLNFKAHAARMTLSVRRRDSTVVVQLIRNQQVVGSNPIPGFFFRIGYEAFPRY